MPALRPLDILNACSASRAVMGRGGFEVALQRWTSASIVARRVYDWGVSALASRSLGHLEIGRDGVAQPPPRGRKA